jgi:hypothetical protein
MVYRHLVWVSPAGVAGPDGVVPASPAADWLDGAEVAPAGQSVTTSPRYTPSSSTPSLAEIQARTASPKGPSGVVPAPWDVWCRVWVWGLGVGVWGSGSRFFIGL